MKSKEDCEVNIWMESTYIPKSTEKPVFITFRNMIYWRSFKDKAELFYYWLKECYKGNWSTFSSYLDKPRELVTEWQHIEIVDSKNEEIYIDIKPKEFDL